VPADRVRLELIDAKAPRVLPPNRETTLRWRRAGQNGSVCIHRGVVETQGGLRLAEDQAGLEEQGGEWARLGQRD
jgi:hypothetical protein